MREWKFYWVYWLIDVHDKHADPAVISNSGLDFNIMTEADEMDRVPLHDDRAAAENYINDLTDADPEHGGIFGVEEIVVREDEL